MTEFIQVPLSTCPSSGFFSQAGWNVAFPAARATQRATHGNSGQLPHSPWPWSWGSWQGVVQHRLISLSQSLLVPCQGQKLGLLMANISSFLLHSSTLKMQRQIHILFLPVKEFTGFINRDQQAIIPRRVILHLSCLDCKLMSITSPFYIPRS